MFHLFLKGGPIMWPLLLTSLVALTTIFERLIALRRDSRRRKPEQLRAMQRELRNGNIATAIEIGEVSVDVSARCLAKGLKRRNESFSMAYQQEVAEELERISRGLPTLDTVITVAPLLGLLGTVTGLIHAFGLMGASELDAPTAITGGIAEALIATAFGLGIAICALVPFNWLNTKIEKSRAQFQKIGTQTELLLLEVGTEDASDEVESLTRLASAVSRS